MYKKIAILTITLFFLCHFHQLNAHKNPFYENVQRDSVMDHWVDSVYNNLNLEEKIAQLLMVRAYSNSNEKHYESIEYLIKKYNIGGLCFFQGGPVRQALLTNRYQALSKVPLLISIDAEWGLGMRLDSTISYPRQMMLGALEDNHLIYEMGSDIAEQLKAIGVHMNFAPVADINNNPSNPVINSRSFGELKYNVAEKSLAYMLGMQNNNILTTAKHFPGHGDTNTDSHYDLPVVKHSKERLDSMELIPFKYMIENGLKGVMVAHMNIPSLEENPEIASTLSNNIVDKLLKAEMGFEGLIVTDALDMQGVAKFHKPGEVEIMALKAGNDILLLPQDVPKAIQRIKKAIRNKEFPKEELERRCKKIIAAKFWVGLDQQIEIDTKNLHSRLNKAKYHALRNKLIENAITLLGNKNELIPIDYSESVKIANVVIGEELTTTFQETCDLYANSDHYNLSGNAMFMDFQNLLGKLANYDLVIVSKINGDQRPWKKFGITNHEVDFIEQLIAQNKTIVNVFSNPYSLKYFRNLENAEAVLVAYENSKVSQHRTAQALFGAIRLSGTLPVSAGKFKAKEGIKTNHAVRLSYGIPEEVGLDSERLEEIDVLVSNAIQEKATPGCQVLIAKDQKIIFNKSYGYHSYMKKKAVTDSSIYDLASITKIAATLPVLMKMQEDCIISLDSTLGKYLPELTTSNKADLKIIDVLTHRARLLSWINYYISTFELIDVDYALFDNKLSNNYPFHLGNHTYLFKDYKFKDGLYEHSVSTDYPFQVAEGLYLHKSFRDTIYSRIINSELREKQEYKYSDLGYYFFKKIIENYYKKPLEIISYQMFFSKLGANTTTFLPLSKFPKDQIVPTQNDYIFRKQLLHGFVHDPGAAMLGGVCGHAGLFSNATDLAKIMQLYLNKGYYGNQRFFNESTFDLFNTAPFLEDENRRGIGFDKPEPDPKKEGPSSKKASLKSFGHTGFTGTIAWADPEENLIYIFLSNRIHPDQNNNKLIKTNVRTDIQDVIYNSFIND